MSNALKCFSLARKTVLIAGASGGVGAHLARIAGCAGARVVLAAPRVGPLKEVAKDIEFENGQAFCVAMDVTDRASVEKAFDSAEDAFGVIDVVLNNVGIGVGPRPLTVIEEDCQAMLSSNYEGIWRVAQCAAQRLVKAGRSGSIINIASTLGLHVSNQFSHYSTAAAGVVQLNKSLALELAHYQIRVNAIALGNFQTNVTDGNLGDGKGQAYIHNNVPMRRQGNLAELQGPFLLLASDAGSFMTGAVLAVDGGLLVSSL